MLGVDNYAGPTSANKEVPTGAEIRQVTIFLCFTNLVSISALLHLNIQQTHSAQGVVAPGAVGGSTQRNQVFHTVMKFLGQNQNSNFMINFRIPKGAQRVREGDKWLITYQVDATFASATQVIYKFYR